MSVNILIKYNKDNIHNSLIPWNIKNISEDIILCINGIIIKKNNKYLIIIPFLLEFLYSKIFLLYNNQENELNIIKYDHILNLILLKTNDENLIIKDYFLYNNINIDMDINIEKNLIIKDNNDKHEIILYKYYLEYNDTIKIVKQYIISCHKNNNIDKIIKLGMSLYDNNNNIKGIYHRTLDNKYIFIPIISIIRFLSNPLHLLKYNYDINNNMIIINENNHIIDSLNDNYKIFISKENEIEEIMININDNIIPLNTYLIYNTSKKIKINYYENIDDFNNNLLKSKIIRLTDINTMYKYKYKLNTIINTHNDIKIIEFNPFIIDWLKKMNISIINKNIFDFINNPFNKLSNNNLLVVDTNNNKLIQQLIDDDINIKIDNDLSYDNKNPLLISLLDINNNIISHFDIIYDL